MINPFRRSSRLPKISLNPGIARRRVRWPWKKIAWWAGGLVGGLVVVAGILTAYYYPKAKPAMAAANLAKAQAKQLSSHVNAQDFAAAQTDIQHLHADLQVIGQQLTKMQGLRAWPYLGRQYTAAVNLDKVGLDSTPAVSALLDYAANLLAPFSGQGKVSLASLSQAQKGQLLGSMAAHEDSLKAAAVAIKRAAADLDRIPESGLIGPLRKVIDPLKQEFPLVTQALDQAIPTTHLLPPLLGYPTAKNYLFLLENNTELRPGGGFIGTYGVMKVQSGEVVAVKTDNSYNLDEAAKKLPIIAPPPPLQQYLKANAWYFRDANWSPDFPTSAEQALVFYQREGGSKNIDGVMAVTPTTITALLKLVGPISIGSEQFTADNFTNKLQSYVDVGYKYAGQSASQRKDIIGPLTSELMNRILRLPLNQWKDLFLILSQQLNEKQIIMYVKDPAVQSLLVQENWAGAMQQDAATDYLLVADANLASLKTDPVMQRTYSYSLNLDGNQPTATLTIHYVNTGKLSWKTTRYNTYVRVYVPAGSTLVSSQGAQKRQMSSAPGPVNTTTELGKTVFGAFKSIEPGTSSDLTMTYTLPSPASSQLTSGTYHLEWQKEAGMLPPTINLKINWPKHPPTSATGLDNLAHLGHTGLSFTGLLDHDRTIVIRY